MRVVNVEGVVLGDINIAAISTMIHKRSQRTVEKEIGEEIPIMCVKKKKFNISQILGKVARETRY